MLKQSAFFDKLEKKKLTVAQYRILYKLYKPPKNLSSLALQQIKNQVPAIYINSDGSELSEQGVKLIKSIEMLFKPLKKLKDIELMGPDFEERIKEYLEIFPTGKLPNGKYARGNKKNIKENFMWFFQEFPEYSWDQVLDATEAYVSEYQKKNYLYMRTAMYFIKKLVDSTVQSELANYCELIESGDDYKKEHVIKANIV
jgi:hypothetical protein